MQVKRVRCESSGVLVPKDKAIKRFIVRNIVDASAIRDIQDASVLEGQSVQLLPDVHIHVHSAVLRLLNICEYHSSRAVLAAQACTTKKRFTQQQTEAQKAAYCCRIRSA